MKENELMGLNAKLSANFPLMHWDRGPFGDDWECRYGPFNFRLTYHRRQDIFSIYGYRYDWDTQHAQDPLVLVRLCCIFRAREEAARLAFTKARLLLKGINLCS